MRAATLRTFTIGLTILICFIMSAQFYWLKKTYAYEENEFNVRVYSALRSVIEAIRLSAKDATPFTGEIEHPRSNYFIADIKYPIDPNSAEFLLKKAFEEYHVFTNFKYGIYIPKYHKYIVSRFIRISTSNLKDDDVPLTVLERNSPYISVVFPSRQAFLLQQMDFWIYSSIMLIVVLIGLTVALFKFFKQKQLSEIQTDFINNMTHEFRTPIATIQLSTEVLKNTQYIKNNQRLFNYATIIENEIGHLENQVERVLQVANSEKRNSLLEHNPVNVHSIIRNTIRDFEQGIALKGGNFNLDLQSTRPVLMADELHFTNMLFNLVDNAIKYSPNPQIRLSTCDENQGIRIDVADNGIGIPKEYQKFLFTRFFRVPKGNLHEVKGFGIGLNYVKEYAKAFGGNITVFSSPGIGSTFSLHFPKTYPVKEMEGTDQTGKHWA